MMPSVSVTRYVTPLREGGSLPWELFNRAHVGRGRQRLQSNELEAALRDFETALTYPENLGVGRSMDHERAAAHYWRGKALAALGRAADARAAWQTGAAEHEGSEEQNEYREIDCLLHRKYSLPPRWDLMLIQSGSDRTINHRVRYTPPFSVSYWTLTPPRMRWKPACFSNFPPTWTWRNGSPGRR